jgi:hypothetical protein
LEKLQRLIKMAQANVVSSAGNITWYTDKAEITANDGAVTYQVYATALGNASAVGNIWSNAVSVAANTSVQVYVGAGNKLTVTGTFTAAELGTDSSAQSGVIGG